MKLNVTELEKLSRPTLGKIICQNERN